MVDHHWHLVDKFIACLAQVVPVLLLLKCFLLYVKYSCIVYYGICI